MGRRFTRRAVIGGGFATAGLGLVGGGSALWLGAPAAGCDLLTEPELAVVAAVTEVMFPAGVFPVDGLQAGVPHEVDRLLGEVLDPLRASGFRYVLRTLEWGTLASRGRPFSQLDVDARREVLEAWADPAVFTRRIAHDSLKVMLGMAYFAHPRVLAHMGWRATCGGGAT